MTDATFEATPQIRTESSPTPQIRTNEQSGNRFLGSIRARFQRVTTAENETFQTQQEKEALLSTRERLKIERYRDKSLYSSARFKLGMQMARQIRHQQEIEKIKEGLIREPNK